MLAPNNQHAAIGGNAIPGLVGVTLAACKRTLDLL